MRFAKAGARQPQDVRTFRQAMREFVGLTYVTRAEDYLGGASERV